MTYAIYNEIEPFAADWLDELVRQGHIAAGRVERRSIAALTAADVAGPGQRHFFAGIGGWSYALRRAGFADDANVWTGSCPCQPFSAAGARGGTSDPRHLWPTWFALIEQCRPPVIFGEQVASKDGLVWLDLVFADLERCGYSVGAADLCAAGVGAPHIRQRLYFVAYAGEGGRAVLGSARLHDHGQQRDNAPRRSEARKLANDDEQRREGSQRRKLQIQVSQTGRRSGLGDASSDRTLEHARELPLHESQHEVGPKDGDHASVVAGATCGFWADAEWLPCIDGVSRPVEPRTFPLAHGVPGRVGRLRGYGNAINTEVAIAFIEASALAAKG